MKKVSLVVPTFNSSFYLEKILRSEYINFFDEVIISDDFSNEADYEQIKKTLDKYSSKNKINYKLIRNDLNLGGFFNKYNGVKESSNELIYQLDTDNLLTKSTINFLDSYSFNPDILYLPGKIFLFKKYKFKNKTVKFTKNKKNFDKLLIQNELNGSTKLIFDKNINWVLNVGNQIFNKSRYLKVLDRKNISTKYLEADAYAQSFFWLKNNLNLEINVNHSHYHRLRNDSYWNTAGEKSIQSVEFYKQSILDL